MKHDSHALTNAVSGCTSNDGEAILAAVREQHRRALEPEPDVGLPMTKCREQEKWLKRMRRRRR